MWLAIGSKEIPNIATNWFVCAVVLGLTQYPVMRAHWKESYARVFLWLVARINESTATGDAVEEGHVRGEIGLLDIFGFESFVINRFEQL